MEVSKEKWLCLVCGQVLDAPVPHQGCRAQVGHFVKVDK